MWNTVDYVVKRLLPEIEICARKGYHLPCNKITMDDYDTLSPGIYLNDIIVDFMMKYMHNNFARNS